jgi:hypothetical protein
MTKRARNLPANFNELLTAVTKFGGEEGGYSNAKLKITYKDEAGDIICVQDDDDLTEAYEVAIECFEGQLKLYIELV